MRSYIKMYDFNKTEHFIINQLWNFEVVFQIDGLHIEHFYGDFLVLKPIKHFPSGIPEIVSLMSINP